MNEQLEVIKQSILEDTDGFPILIYIIAEGCHEHTSTVVEGILDMISVHNLEVKFYTICLNEDQMPFPRPLTKVLYYFKPHDITPLLHRIDSNIEGFLAHDVNKVKRIIEGETPEGVFYSEEQLEKKKEIEEMFEEESKRSHKFPSKLNMLRSAAKQLYYSAKAVKGGMPVLVSSDVAQKRFELCEDCEFFDHESTRCKECGCFMKVKINLAGAKCPIDKWGSTI